MKNNCIAFLLSLLSFTVFGQFRSFRYAAEIQTPTSAWHKLLLEENVLGAAQDDLSDIRIFQVSGSDTTEAPYLFGEKESDPALSLLKNGRFRITENKALKQTVISAGFQQKIPVSGIKFSVENKFDYYRKISLYASMDSIDETAYENAQLAFSGHISSLEPTDFNFEQVLARHFLIIIENEDNKPLPIKSCEALYRPVSLLARFENGGKYFLCYGGPGMSFPDYDINYFRDKIPANASTLSYEIIESGPETEEPAMKRNDAAADPAWLWLAVSLIVLILLVFTLRMLKAKS
ncbi:MAG: hypothetical protein ACO1O6_05175 [Bacteroidota bacterium]